MRRFWVAAIGANAVAELLRLVSSAKKGESVRLPRTLPLLLRSGLAEVDQGSLVVGARMPLVPLELRWRFPSHLIEEHKKHLRR